MGIGNTDTCDVEMNMDDIQEIFELNEENMPEPEYFTDDDLRIEI